MEQILTNLIANALKSTPEGGKVTVLAEVATRRDRLRVARGGARRAPEYVKVSVLDTGPGIPEDKLETVFDRYEQLKGKKGERGSGLGLAICRYLVEGQGGAIWAQRGPKAGAMFCFLLPSYRGEAPASGNGREGIETGGA